MKDVREIPFKEMVKQYMKDTMCEDKKVATEACLQMRGWQRASDGWLAPKPNTQRGGLCLDDAVKMEEIFDGWEQTNNKKKERNNAKKDKSG